MQCFHHVFSLNWLPHMNMFVDLCWMCLCFDVESSYLQNGNMDICICKSTFFGISLRL